MDRYTPIADARFLPSIFCFLQCRVATAVRLVGDHVLVQDIAI